MIYSLVLDLIKIFTSFTLIKHLYYISFSCCILMQKKSMNKERKNNTSVFLYTWVSYLYAFNVGHWGMIFRVRRSARTQWTNVGHSSLWVYYTTVERQRICYESKLQLKGSDAKTDIPIKMKSKYALQKIKVIAFSCILNFFAYIIFCIQTLQLETIFYSFK